MAERSDSFPKAASDRLDERPRRGEAVGASASEGKMMTPAWIKCTLKGSGKPIRINMAVAATYVPHEQGTRVWIPGDQIGIDVVELPDDIDAALAGVIVDDQSA
jgi:hypothetical protein